MDMESMERWPEGVFPGDAPRGRAGFWLAWLPWRRRVHHERRRGRRPPWAAAACGERLEERAALAVAPLPAATPTRAPSVWMTAATDTGVRDEITFLATPAFAGKATPGAVLRVEEGGRLVGMATANKAGDWSLATPAAKAFAAGPHTIRVTATAKGSLASQATPYGFRIDNAAPTATLTYDNTTCRAVLRFSRPVTGVTAATLQLSGRTASGVSLAMTLADARLAAYAGKTSVIASADRTTYTFATATMISEAGSYQLTALTSPKIVDSVVGNPFTKSVSVRFSV